MAKFTPSGEAGGMHVLDVLGYEAARQERVALEGDGPLSHGLEPHVAGFNLAFNQGNLSPHQKGLVGEMAVFNADCDTQYGHLDTRATLTTYGEF